MHNRILRPLLIVEFLIAIEAIFTLWSEVGGQYHLDLMFWPWKLGIGAACAGLIVAITANLVRNEGQITRRTLWFCSLLIVVVIGAGVVTYYYHVHEPVDEQDDEQDDEQAKITSMLSGDRQSAKDDRLPYRLALPDPAGVSAVYHR
jgi:hypothetical protein